MQGLISSGNGIDRVLFELYEERKWGCLIVKSQGKLIQVSFQAGQLVAVVCRTLKGRPALDELLQVREGQYNFMDGLELKHPRQDDLPDIRSLLGLNPSPAPRIIV
jgi:hypothetical protein